MRGGNLNLPAAHAIIVFGMCSLRKQAQEAPMNILVCVKQVPNTRHMTIDPQSQRLVRHGVSAMINPADRSALEKALRLRDQQGGRLTVITMGAPQAADVLVSAHLVGADRCILLTAPAFAGSDTFATASVLAAAIRYEQQRTGEDFDIIYCGSSTIDGETGQVGPELAELLGIPNFTNVSALGFNGVTWELEYRLEDMEMRVCAAPPVLVSCPLTDDACLRSAIPARLERIGEIEFPRLGMDALLPWLNPAETGLNGSATRVLRSYVPSTQRRCVRIEGATAREKAERLAKRLAADGYLGGKISASAPVEAQASCERGGDRLCVFVEQNRSGECKGVSLELLTPAIEIAAAAGLRVSAILAGADNAKAAAALAQYPVDEILSCQDAALADLQLHDYVEAVAAALRLYSPLGLLVGATELGRQLAARIAARFRTGLTADCTGIGYDAEAGGIIWSRPAYGGKLMADIICREKRPQMGTVREGVFARPARRAGRASIVSVPFERGALSDRIALLRRVPVPGFNACAGNEVSMVVGMGRGVRDMDGFDLCCDFADAIGADIGASRGATDMRLVARQYLIGSNGRTVRPGVYFACGISGSLQHMIGVLDSGCIVAINRDPDAEIHRYANYSVVDDLFSVLPALQEYLLEYL